VATAVLLTDIRKLCQPFYDTLNEEIPARYHRQAVADLETLAEDIDIIAEQFNDVHGADVEFTFDIGIGEIVEANNEL
jgi:hypothetical protein